MLRGLGSLDLLPAAMVRSTRSIVATGSTHASDMPTEIANSTETTAQVIHHTMTEQNCARTRRFRLPAMVPPTTATAVHVRANRGSVVAHWCQPVVFVSMVRTTVICGSALLTSRARPSALKDASLAAHVSTPQSVA